MKLLTQDKPFFPEKWAEKFAYLKSMGFDGFEIDGQALIKHFDEIQKACIDEDFPVCMVCGGYNGWIGDFNQEKRNQGIQDIHNILVAAQKIGAKGIVLPAAWGMFSKRLPPMVPPRSEQDDKLVLLDSLRRLDEIAIMTQTTIYLEPLNRYEDHMLNRIEDAAHLIQIGDFKHVHICYDFFHMNIEEPQMDQPILDFRQWIGHIHLASSHRYQPGSGHMDYLPGLKALSAINYNGFAAFESRVVGQDLDKAYRDSIIFMRQQIKKAGL